MQFTVVCPNRRWNARNPVSAAGMQVMRNAGFEIVPDGRQDGLFKVAPMTVELGTLEDLLALQERIGTRLILDGQILEVDAG